VYCREGHPDAIGAVRKAKELKPAIYEKPSTTKNALFIRISTRTANLNDKHGFARSEFYVFQGNGYTNGAVARCGVVFGWSVGGSSACDSDALL
jgi:hypothetical protein